VQILVLYHFRLGRRFVHYRTFVMQRLAFYHFVLIQRQVLYLPVEPAKEGQIYHFVLDVADIVSLKMVDH
jgi:hypothetical protein